VNPEERADTTALRTRRHTLRNLKVREPGPHTGLVNTENRKVLRLNSPNIALVRNGQRTALEIVQALRMVRLGARIRTDVVRVVLVADVAAFGRGEEGGGSFVAGDFGGGGFAGWKCENVAVVRGKIEVVVEPPLGEGHVFDRCDWSVVVGKGFVCHVEPKHAWMPES